MRSPTCPAFAVVTEPAVVTRNVSVCGGGGDKTGRQRLVYRSVTNRLLLSVWLQQQIAEDAPYFMLKYEGWSRRTLVLTILTFFIAMAMYKRHAIQFRHQISLVRCYLFVKINVFCQRQLWIQNYHF